MKTSLDKNIIMRRNDIIGYSEICFKITTNQIMLKNVNLNKAKIKNIFMKSNLHAKSQILPVDIQFIDEFDCHLTKAINCWMLSFNNYNGEIIDEMVFEYEKFEI